MFAQQKWDLSPFEKTRLWMNVHTQHCIHGVNIGDAWFQTHRMIFTYNRMARHACDNVLCSLVWISEVPSAIKASAHTDFGDGNQSPTTCDAPRFCGRRSFWIGETGSRTRTAVLLEHQRLPSSVMWLFTLDCTNHVTHPTVLIGYDRRSSWLFTGCLRPNSVADRGEMIGHVGSRKTAVGD